VPWGGTFATLERRPWGSLEKDLHLLWALLWISNWLWESQCCLRWVEPSAFPAVAGVRQNYTPWPACKMLLPQNVHSLPLPWAWGVGKQPQRAAVYFWAFGIMHPIMCKCIGSTSICDYFEIKYIYYCAD
jgi:hypothetical protein